MDPEKEIESLEGADEHTGADDTVSVDDFIRELEAKEKDLHITAETTVIEIAESFEDGEIPEFLKEEFPAKTAKPASVVVKPAADDVAKAKLEAEVKQLREKLSKAVGERDELIEASQRRSKDFANYKARIERERLETFKNQVTNLATQMLPALDNLNRALDFALDLPRQEKGDFQHFVDGVVIVNQQVNEVLAEMGIEPIATVGEQFDPHIHEAAATEETDLFEPNTISGELLKGYRIGDHVVRHSIVRVARPVPKTEEQSVLEKMFHHDASESPVDDGKDIENEPAIENPAFE